MSKGKTKPLEQESIAQGEAAFESVRARAEAVPAGALQVRGLNFDDVESRLRGILKEMRSDADIEARLRLLPEQILDPVHYETLPSLVRALSYSSMNAKNESAVMSDALVPLALVERATEIKARLLELVTYYLKRHPVHGPEIDDIRSGTGHLDLASDVDRLCAMVAKNRGLLENDPVNYRASDITEGPQVAIAIRAAYNAAPVSVWADRTRRVYALIDAHYAEVRAAAQLVFRHDPKRARVFIALRPGGGPRPKRDAAVDGVPPVAPEPDDTPTAAPAKTPS